MKQHWAWPELGRITPLDWLQKGRMCYVNLWNYQVLEATHRWLSWWKTISFFENQKCDWLPISGLSSGMNPRLSSIAHYIALVIPTSFVDNFRHSFQTDNSVLCKFEEGPDIQSEIVILNISWNLIVKFSVSTSNYW